MYTWTSCLELALAICLKEAPKRRCLKYIPKDSVCLHLLQKCNFLYSLLNDGIRLFSLRINVCKKCEAQTEWGLRFSLCLYMEAQPVDRAQEKQGIKYGTFSSPTAGDTHSSENNVAPSPLSDSLRFGNKHHEQLEALPPHWPQGRLYQLCHKPNVTFLHL